MEDPLVLATVFIESGGSVDALI